jgi:hypothetical protein
MTSEQSEAITQLRASTSSAKDIASLHAIASKEGGSTSPLMTLALAAM